MSYWRLHYHLVWATQGREPSLDEYLERQIYGAILDKSKELGIVVHAVGNVQDHIHLAVSIPPRIAVADCVRHIKGASSYRVNHQPDAPGGFGWQDGYGALTFGDRAMRDVIAYVLNQKEHHQLGSILPPFERTSDEDQGVEITSGV